LLRLQTFRFRCSVASKKTSAGEPCSALAVRPLTCKLHAYGKWRSCSYLFFWFFWTDNTNILSSTIQPTASPQTFVNRIFSGFIPPVCNVCAPEMANNILFVSLQQLVPEQEAVNQRNKFHSKFFRKPCVIGYFMTCHCSCSYSPASHLGELGSIPGQSVWDLW